MHLIYVWLVLSILLLAMEVREIRQSRSSILRGTAYLEEHEGHDGVCSLYQEIISDMVVRRSKSLRMEYALAALAVLLVVVNGAIVMREVIA